MTRLRPDTQGRVPRPPVQRISNQRVQLVKTLAQIGAVALTVFDAKVSYDGFRMLGLPPYVPITLALLILAIQLASGAVQQLGMNPFRGVGGSGVMDFMWRWVLVSVYVIDIGSNAIAFNISQYFTLTRMGDFERWGTAAETALGFPEGAFLDAFQANIVDLRDAGIEANPVAAALMSLMETRDEWQGTPTELLKALEGLVSEETRRSRAFPRVPNLLGKILKRIQTDLQQCVEICSEKSNGTRFIRLRKIKDSVVPVVPVASKPCETSNLSGTTEKNCRPCVVPVDPDRDDSREGRGDTGATEKMVSSLPQSLSQSGSQPFRVNRDDKINAYSKCLAPALDSVNSPLQSSGNEEWVYWWRVDTLVKVLEKRGTYWRVRVPGERGTRTASAEEFENGEGLEVQNGCTQA